MTTARARLFLGWSAINFVFTALGLILTLWLLGQRTEQHEQFMRLLEERQRGCAPVVRASSPTTPTPVLLPPPRQDPARSGYLGAAGMDISAAMGLDLEVLLPGDVRELSIATLRLGSPRALPPRTIHVVNLWATWCDPCLAELPGLKAMFARHREWDDVRFVPIQLKDHTDPLRSYGDYAGIMPPAPVRLADRTASDRLASTLAAGEDGGLYRGKLPVTLILDCNRRVRWASFEQLTAADLTALEPLISRLRNELRDTSPGAWCRQEWPGNGRCEALERTAAHHSLADCGPLRRRSSAAGIEALETTETTDPGPVVTPPPELPTTCPPRTRLRNGKCTRLQKVPEVQDSAPVPSSLCGNGVCDASESRSSCCSDCPCAERFVCESVRVGEAPRCRAALQP